MKKLGPALRAIGIATMLFSYFILFWVVEPIVGMEAIVGKENVIREPNGSYLYTNPFAIWFWVAVIVFFGFIINRMGWSLIKSQAQK